MLFVGLQRFSFFVAFRAFTDKCTYGLLALCKTITAHFPQRNGSASNRRLKVDGMRWWNCMGFCLLVLSAQLVCLAQLTTTSNFHYSFEMYIFIGNYWLLTLCVAQCNLRRRNGLEICTIIWNYMRIRYLNVEAYGVESSGFYSETLKCEWLKFRVSLWWIAYRENLFSRQKIANQMHSSSFLASFTLCVHHWTNR